MYRPEIDGLRTIAVIPVILFHLGLNAFSGGYVGVDVFFVISGYLITTIIIKEIELNTFSLLNFYQRRARRILPALFVVCFVSLVFAWYILTPSQLKEFGQSLSAVSVYISNIYFWETRDYFSQSAEYVPLLHTWSLGIEEQYYLFIPILLFFLWKRAALCLSVLITIFIVSFVASEYLAVNDANSAFYLLHSRMWELLAGSFCAVAISKQWLSYLSTKYFGFFSLVGLLLILFSVVFYTKDTVFPGVAALVPVLGSVLIILFCHQQTLVYRLLSLKVMVSIGLVSYSAYLWHHPLFAFFRFQEVNFDNLFVSFLLILTTLLVAFFSWKFVEGPFRDRNKIKSTHLYSFVVFFTVFFFLVGLTLHFKDGFPSRFSNKQVDLINTAKISPYRNACHTSGMEYLDPSDACQIRKGSDNIAVVGDSHGVEIAYTLAKSSLPNYIGVYQYTFSSCGFHSFVDNSNEKLIGCREYLEEALNEVIISDEITDVVMVFFHESIYEKMTVEQLRRYVSTFVESAEKMIDAGKRVSIILPIPKLDKHIERYVYDSSFLLDDFSVERDISKHLAANSEFIKELKKYDRMYSGKLNLVDPMIALCDERVCYGSDLNGLYYFDSHHLSVIGASKVSDLIVKKLYPRN